MASKTAVAHALGVPYGASSSSSRALSSAARLLVSPSFTALDERDASINLVARLCIEGNASRRAAAFRALGTALAGVVAPPSRPANAFGWGWERGGASYAKPTPDVATPPSLQRAVALAYTAITGTDSSHSHIRTCRVLVEGGALNLLCAFAANAAHDHASRVTLGTFILILDVIAELASCTLAADESAEAAAEVSSARSAMAAERLRKRSGKVTAGEASHEAALQFLQLLHRTFQEGAPVAASVGQLRNALSRYWCKRNVMMLAGTMKRFAARDSDGEDTQLVQLFACRAIGALAELHAFAGWACIALAHAFATAAEERGPCSGADDADAPRDSPHTSDRDLSWLLSLVTTRRTADGDGSETKGGTMRFGIALTLAPSLTALKPMHRDLFQTQLMNARARWAVRLFLRVGYFDWPAGDVGSVGGVRGTTVTEHIGRDVTHPTAGKGGEETCTQEKTDIATTSASRDASCFSDFEVGTGSSASGESIADVRGKGGVFANNAELQRSMWGMVCEFMHRYASDYRCRFEGLNALSLLLFLEAWVFDARQLPASMPNKLEQQCIVDEALASIEDMNAIERTASRGFSTTEEEERKPKKRRRSSKIRRPSLERNSKNPAEEEEMKAALCAHEEFYAMLAHACTILWLLSNFNREHAELLTRHTMRAPCHGDPICTLHVSLQFRIRALCERWADRGAASTAYLAFHASALRVLQELAEVGRDCKNEVNALSEPWELIPLAGLNGAAGTAVLCRGLSLLIEIVKGNSIAAADLASDFKAEQLWVNALLSAVSISFAECPIVVEHALSLLSTLARYISYPDEVVRAQAATFWPDAPMEVATSATKADLTVVALYQHLGFALASMERFPSDSKLVERGACAVECACACLARLHPELRSGAMVDSVAVSEDGAGLLHASHAYSAFLTGALAR